MSMMFFVPNMLLSGFIFPFLGMPKWAQVISGCLPLTHFMRIARSIMLKGSTPSELRYDALALAILMAVAMIIAVTRFPAHGTRLRDRLRKRHRSGSHRTAGWGVDRGSVDRHRGHGR
jgi:ABC-type multidrug transport system permease subunit